jgi:ribokinase
MPAKIVVVGSANTDFVIQVPELPGPGETVLGGQFVTARGGKGANQAVGAARLGAQVSFVARLGSDRLGQEAIDAYRQEGIDTRYIQQDPLAASGVALILVNHRGENMIAVAPGANHCLSPRDVRAAEPAVQEADILLLQLEIPLETVQEAVALAKRHSVRVILNPAPAAPVSLDILRSISVLTPNETELALLLGEGAPLDPESAAGRFYQQTGLASLVVTLGSQGALLVSESEVDRIPAFPVKPVDTTACGDAFNAALAVRLGEGASLRDAVRYANGAGALAATRAGAQPSLATRAELEKLLHA